MARRNRNRRRRGGGNNGGGGGGGDNETGGAEPAMTVEEPPVFLEGPPIDDPEPVEEMEEEEDPVPGDEAPAPAEAGNDESSVPPPLEARRDVDFSSDDESGGDTSLESDNRVVSLHSLCNFLPSSIFICLLVANYSISILLNLSD